MSDKKDVRIDIVSDVVCPWCIVGHLKLQQALRENPDVNAQIFWHPFELNPNMEQGGQNLREHIMEKYGSTVEQSQAARERLTELGVQLGFTFKFDEESRIYNTMKAHQLLHLARKHDKEQNLKLRFFRDYFTDQKAMDDDEVLIKSAVQEGLDEQECQDTLKDGKFVEEIIMEIQTFQSNGIHAVPAFIINQQYLVQGAQDPDVFGNVFAKL